MKTAKISAIAIHFFVGIGGIAGGSAAIADPSRPLNIPPEVLKYGPFSSFLVPGIILFSLIGIGNVLTGIAVLRKMKFNEYLTGLMGIILAVWLIIQCLILRGIGYLHVIFFIIAVIQGTISLYMLYEKNMFPLNF